MNLADGQLQENVARGDLGRLEECLVASDQVTKHAYGRMTLDDYHRWTRHTTTECEHIIDYCGIEKEHSVLDFGCGAGRHAIELAKSGVQVTGVDYAGNLVNKARSRRPAR